MLVFITLMCSFAGFDLWSGVKCMEDVDPQQLLKTQFEAAFQGLITIQFH